MGEHNRRLTGEEAREAICLLRMQYADLIEITPMKLSQKPLRQCRLLRNKAEDRHHLCRSLRRKRIEKRLYRTLSFDGSLEANLTCHWKL